MLSRREPYKELGPMHYEERRKAAVIKQSIRKLEALGFTVTVQAAAS